jgi:HK97 family phage portal protein
MGLIDYLLGYSSSAPSIFPHDPTDERAWSSAGNREYWGGFSGPALTGGFVRPDDAIGVSALFLGVRIWCNVLGTAPLRFYRQLATGEETPYPSYRLARMLSTDGLVNPSMSGAIWRMWTIAQQILWGLGLSEIKFGANGLELWPIEGDSINRIDQLDNGKIVFHLNEPGKSPRKLTQDQVFRAEGASTHHLIPEAVLRRAREAVGAWLAQEQYRSYYFKNGASPSVVFTHPGPQPISDKTLERLKVQLQARAGGVGNAHRTLVMEDGITAKAFGTNAKDALMVEAWNNQVLEFARFLEMPAFLLDATATLPYNSRESAMKEWVGIAVRPRGRLLEASYRRDLFIESDVVCEHDLDDLVAGDVLEQQQADTGYANGGIKSVNEIRVRLGLPKLAGDEYDLPRRSANIGTADPGGNPDVTPRPGDKLTPPPPKGPPPSQTPPAAPGKGKKDKKGKSAGSAAANDYAEVGLVGDQDAALYMQMYKAGFFRDPRIQPERVTKIVTASARHLLRRETEQLRRRGIQLAAKPTEWKTWVADFYTDHRAKMVAGLAIDENGARTYTEAHEEEVVRDGIGVCERWEKGEAVKMMVEMVMGGTSE